MHAVTVLRRAAALLVPALAAGTFLAAAPVAAAAAGGSACGGYTAGGGWWVQCHTPAAGQAPVGSSGHPVCTWSSDVQGFFPGFTANAPAAPAGFTYLIQVCGKTYGLPQLVAAGAAATPAALAQRAYQELRPPLPAPHTAPPRGSDGLVGLPEWFWVPAGQWVPQTRTVTAGAVWARVTATPSRLVFTPGGAQPATACPGPGTVYNKAEPAAGQHSACTYTYTQSSDGQPGNTYAASVSVTWTATWAGSGGTGGALPPLTRAAAFAVPVAEAQSLNGA